MQPIVANILLIGILFPSAVFGNTTDYELTIAFETVSFTGNQVQAMTINGAIPGPTLSFTEGDTARITVHNRMDVATSIHWHGILVPPGMDGVPYVSFPPIKPHSSFTYEFPIRQSGTYWYHSHSGLQEQRGVYGPIVIQPEENGLKADREFVILLSDWTDEDPQQVLRTLKRGSEWYSIAKGSGQSAIGAARIGMLGDYLKRELQRMPAMDIADVAYDRFLANGQPVLNLEAEPGEKVRLRIIDGSATTNFHLEYAGGPLEIVAADGIEVEPFQEKRMLIAVAETYDALIRLPDSGAYELRATAHDGSGYASVFIGKGMKHAAPEVPKANLYHAMGHFDFKQIFALTPAGSMGMPDALVSRGKFDRPGMMEMPHAMNNAGHDLMPRADEGRQGHGRSGHTPAAGEMTAKKMVHETPTAHGSMRHEENSMAGMTGGDKGMEMDRAISKDMTAVSAPQSGKRYAGDFRLLASDVSAAARLAMDGMDHDRPWPPYEKLRALDATSFATDKPVREIRLTLDGDMERYVWFFNEKALSETDAIAIKKGEVVRFIMINRTMMHHPIHLHGHFFRVVNQHGDHSPLKHTVDVAPMSTTVIEFDANETGDWFFHCHLLYHMKSGMARLVHYNDFAAPPEVAGIRRHLYKESWYFQGKADLLSSMTEGRLRLSDTRNNVSAAWEIGWEEVEKNEWEGTLTLGRYLNRFAKNIFAGMNALGQASETDHVRAILGLDYLLPLNIDMRSWVDTDGGMRVEFEKAIPLTPRLSLMGEAEYDTHTTKWEGKAGLEYALSKQFSVIGQWHADYQWGVGVQVRF